MHFLHVKCVFCTYFTYYATCISIYFEKYVYYAYSINKNECILTRISETVAEYHYLSLDLKLHLVRSYSFGVFFTVGVASFT